MSELSRSTAIELISTWNTKEVIEILEKNGLEDCCSAVQKRQIDGDELLHLTEGKLALWKRDLSRPKIRNLWSFVERLNQTPQKFVSLISQQREEPISDSGSWGTDFEDDDDEDSDKSNNQQHNNQNDTSYIPERSLNFRNSLLMFQKPDKLNENLKTIDKQENISETIYNNCSTETDYHNENTYMNSKDDENISTIKKSNTCTLVKNLSISSSSVYQEIHSDILKKSKDNNQHEKKNIKLSDKSIDELPRPPTMLTNFDLVSNLPIKAEESEDEYEQFDEKIIIENQKKFASCNSINGSIESFVGSKTDSSGDSREKDEEIYESITEMPEDSVNRCPQNKSSFIKESPPPLPAKPLVPVDVSALQSTMPKKINETETKQTINFNSSIHKKTCLSECLTEATLTQARMNLLKRTPDKKSSMLDIRATRPLPPPPEKQSYMDCSWFHNVSREQGIALIKERQLNGYFLLRPSSSNPNNPLALVLWFKDRVYNVPVRKRSDNKYALGSPKINEQTFLTIEDIVKFHSREALMLNSGGVQTGCTKLTETPSK